jgi:hypothetical protein
MILKMRLVPENDRGLECWAYYEGEKIVVEYIPDCRLDMFQGTPNAVFDPTEEPFRCWVLRPQNGEAIFFNTEAWLMNKDGKTVDHFSRKYPLPIIPTIPPLKWMEPS